MENCKKYFTLKNAAYVILGIFVIWILVSCLSSVSKSVSVPKEIQKKEQTDSIASMQKKIREMELQLKFSQKEQSLKIREKDLVVRENALKIRESELSRVSYYINTQVAKKEDATQNTLRQKELEIKKLTMQKLQQEQVLKEKEKIVAARDKQIEDMANDGISLFGILFWLLSIAGLIVFYFIFLETFERAWSFLVGYCKRSFNWVQECYNKLTSNGGVKSNIHSWVDATIEFSKKDKKENDVEEEKKENKDKQDANMPEETQK